MIILTVFLILIILTIIHEFGHFLAAKITGVKILEFQLGFGPRLCSINAGGVKWSVKLLPFGGGVQMDDKSLDSKTALQRLYVTANGVIFNFIAGFIFFMLTAITAPGMQADFIKAMSYAVGHFTYYTTSFFSSLGDTVVGIIGIARTDSSLAAMQTEGKKIYDLATQNNILLQLILEVSGYFSIMFGLFNILPIPALDGGYVLLYLIEIITKKKPDETIRNKVVYTAFIAILTLSGYIMSMELIKYMIALAS